MMEIEKKESKETILMIKLNLRWKEQPKDRKKE
jgi:hypothetical protein